MDSRNFNEMSADEMETNIKHLKEKYSKEMRDAPDNPMKVCTKLIFESATERDPIKREELAIQVSEFLTRPGGVINLILALIDFDQTSQKETTLNQRFISVASIIAKSPKLCMPFEKYCDNIAQQLKPLLISDKETYSTLACIVIKNLISSPHAKGKDVEKIIFGPITDALIRPGCCFKPHESIIAIFNLIVNHAPIEYFVNLFPNLYYGSVTLRDTPSGLKTYLKSSMLSILNSMNPGAACCLVERTLFYSDNINHLYESYTGKSGISLRVRQVSPNDDEQVEGGHLNYDILLSLIRELDENFVLELFFHFQSILWTTTNETTIEVSKAIIEFYLEETTKERSSKFNIYNMISNNKGKSLELIARSMVNYTLFLRSYERQPAKIPNSLTDCLNILEALSSGHLDSQEERIVRQRCLPMMKQLQEILKTRDEYIKSTPYKTLQSLTLGLELKLECNDEVDDTGSKRVDSLVAKEFSDILKDLNDKLVPVRVHALVRLKQMVLMNDTYTIERIPQIFSLVESSMADHEPYVFLSCINLLAEMAVRRTDELLPRLMEYYSKPELELQHRINIGEVLVRLTKQMNAMTPFYAQQVMGVLLKGCEDSEELIRMSSLTNVGQLSNGLGDSLGKYIVTILNRVEVIMKTDTIDVKRAAVDLLRTSLMGLDKLTVESIQMELGSMYKLLKDVKSRTLDEALCLQVDMALEEIGRLARGLLGLGSDSRHQDRKLVKNINMLSLLD